MWTLMYFHISTEINEKGDRQRSLKKVSMKDKTKGKRD